ncbi:MAG: DUF6261 family protein [Cyclobacteriaceae bacterium]
MIKTALFKKYRTNEFIQFISNTLMIVKEHGADKLKVKAAYSSLNKHHQQLAEAYKQATQSEITPQLAKLDDQRDEAIICLRQICEGYTNHHQEEKRMAGQTILNCIAKYGNRLYNLNYSAETTALKNLASDLLTEPECLAAVQTVHMEEVVTYMQTTNQQFEELFIQRLKEASQLETMTMTERSQLTADVYRSLVQHVQAHATLSPSELYTGFINHLNENIEYFNQLVDRRKRGEQPDVTAINEEVRATPLEA